MISADIVFHGIVKAEYRARIAEHVTICDWTELIDIPGVDKFLESAGRECRLPNRREVYWERLLEVFPNHYDVETGEWRFVCGFNTANYFNTFCGVIEYIIPVIFEKVFMFEMIDEFADPERWVNGYRMNEPEDIEGWFVRKEDNQE